VVAFEDKGKDLQVLSFDDELSEGEGRDDGNALRLRSKWEDHNHDRGKVRYVAVALGDVDGDSYDALNGEVCEEVNGARMVAMVNAPPYWDREGISNADGTSVGYGESASMEKSEENYATTSHSGQITLDLSADIPLGEKAGLEIGPQFTWEWGKSLTLSWVKGTSISERKGWNSNRAMGFVVVNNVREYCYQYRGGQGSDNGGIGWRDVHSFENNDIGKETQGIGADFYDINGNGVRDLVVAWMDNPAGENNLRYAIAWDVDEEGEPSGWSSVYKVYGPWWGASTDYIGVAVADVNRNGRPDLVVAWIDDPEGANTAYYRIGWDLDSQGAVQGWSSYDKSSTYTISVDGNFYNQGAGLDIADINNDGKLDMIFAWIDNPSGENTIYYRIGWGMGTDGRVVWSDTKTSNYLDNIGHLSEGLAVTVGHFDNDDTYDIMFAWVDNPDADNAMYYVIGEDLKDDGTPTTWRGRSSFTGLGWDTDGAFVAAADIVIGDEGLTEVMGGWIDNPSGYNKIVFKLGRLEKMRVCVPVSVRADAKFMDWWNDPDGARETYGRYWVPAYRTAWKSIKQVQPGGTGWETQGIGADFYDFNGNGTPDLFFAWVDNPSGPNKVLYRFGWDMDADGNVNWSDIGGINTGFGDEIGGLGVGIADLNGNGRPEIVLGWADNSSTPSLYYRVGWDVSSGGAVSRWDDPRSVGTVAFTAQGVGLDLYDIDGNGRPDLVFSVVMDMPYTYEGGVNRGVYMIGWNLDSNGDVSDWGEQSSIKGAFGAQDQGMGLTVADTDADGKPELLVNWMRNPEGANTFAYVIGDDLNSDGSVDYWVPGVPIPGWIGHETAGVAVSAADLIGNDGRPEMLFAWMDNPSGENYAYYRIGQYWPFGVEGVDNYPSEIEDSDPDDGVFKVKLYDQWWEVAGDVIWEFKNGTDPVMVTVNSPTTEWELEEEEFVGQSTTTSEYFNFSLGGEAKIAGVGLEGSHTWGWEDGNSFSISWGDGFYMEGTTGGIDCEDDGCDDDYPYEYEYVPFMYTQQTLSNEGVGHGYSVLDYYVPKIGYLTSLENQTAVLAVSGQD
ncbi:MAG: hypothetical protein DRI61_12250, partial [Chloroflexi bacterium]